MMVTALLMWFFQNLLQVFFMGWVLMPDLFFMYMFYQTTALGSKLPGAIWVAFLGGLLWDLRWSSLLGLNAIAYVGALMLVFWLWNLMPKSGRTPLIFASIMFMGHLCVAVFRLVVLGVTSQHMLHQVVLQQAYAVVLSFIFGFVFFKRGEKSNAS
ncbi:MAG: rod shape-determining protein MreD [Thermovirga sp.]|jgi:cell shape-determining protein MreD|nr:rod shape-determining protein MreD [Thermovirga sp.]MDN5367579.1 rod shape-determining protein MreD [Thermovirga sp.]